MMQVFRSTFASLQYDYPLLVYLSFSSLFSSSFSLFSSFLFCSQSLLLLLVEQKAHQQPDKITNPKYRINFKIQVLIWFQISISYQFSFFLKQPSFLLQFSPLFLPRCSLQFPLQSESFFFFHSLPEKLQSLSQ